MEENIKAFNILQEGNFRRRILSTLEKIDKEFDVFKDHLFKDIEPFIYIPKEMEKAFNIFRDKLWETEYYRDILPEMEEACEFFRTVPEFVSEIKKMCEKIRGAIELERLYESLEA
jgi:hypothetical protein